MSTLYQLCKLSLKSSRPQIRGLTIFKGGHEARVRCELGVYPFGNASERPKYNALSYSWGSAMQKSVVYINGHRILVTPSAYEALKCLRKEDEDVMVWIDALCIDQSNEEEKNNQVAMMADIYSSAQEISIWLGQEDDTTAVAFEFLRTLHSKWDSLEWLESAYHDDSLSAEWIALDHLFVSVQYWTRVWIMQECIIGSNRVVYKGKLKAPWQMFLELNNLIIGPRQPPGGTYADRLVRDLPVPITMQRKDLKDRGIRQQFLNLLAMARYQSCARAHDRIYGILQIFTDEHRFKIPVRYDLPAERVYRETAVRLVEHTGKLDILALSEPTNTSMRLPSWCPDWHTKRRQSNIFMVYGIGSPMASRNLEAYYSFSKDSSRLSMDAIFVDQVGTLFEPYAPRPGRSEMDVVHDKLADVREKVERWSKELCQDVYEDEAERIRRRSALHSTLMRRNSGLADNVDLNDERENAESLFDLADMHEAFLTIQNRAFFMSKKRGMMGLAPDNTQVGDQVVVVKGCRVPLILREVPEGYCLVGEVFVRGIMFGEALDLGLGFQRITLL